MLLSITCLLALWFQSPPPVFQADSNLVPVGVQVIDPATGQPISGLTRDDFLVLDEDIPTKILAFDNGQRPLDIVLILDVHAAILGEGINFSLGAVHRLLRPDDRVAVVMNHQGKPKLLSGWTTTPAERTAAYRPVHRRGNRYGKDTRLYDAVRLSADFIGKTQDLQRPVILAITHNREDSSQVSKSELIDSLLSSSARLEAISIPQYWVTPRRKIVTLWNVPWKWGVHQPPPYQPPTPPEMLRDIQSLEPVAAATGGQVVRFKYRNASRVPVGRGNGRTWNSDEMAQIFDKQVMSRLRETYKLSIRGVTAASSSFHRLTVRLSETARQRYPQAEVRTRTGYFTAVKIPESKQ